MYLACVGGETLCSLRHRHRRSFASQIHQTIRAALAPSELVPKRPLGGLLQWSGLFRLRELIFGSAKSR
jgi:hypothetical protein